MIRLLVTIREVPPSGGSLEIGNHCEVVFSILDQLV